MSKKKTYKCGECGAVLGSAAWLTRHKNTEHAYIPPPPPKRTIQSMGNVGLTETHRLEGAVGTVKIGDSINIDTKYVVRKTTETEGSKTLEVELEKVRGTWSKN